MPSLSWSTDEECCLLFLVCLGLGPGEIRLGLIHLRELLEFLRSGCLMHSDQRVLCGDGMVGSLQKEIIVFMCFVCSGDGVGSFGYKV